MNIKSSLSTAPWTQFSGDESDISVSHARIFENSKRISNWNRRVFSSPEAEMVLSHCLSWHPGPGWRWGWLSVWPAVAQQSWGPGSSYSHCAWTLLEEISGESGWYSAVAGLLGGQSSWSGWIWATVQLPAVSQSSPPQVDWLWVDFLTCLSCLLKTFLLRRWYSGSTCWGEIPALSVYSLW